MIKNKVNQNGFSLIIIVVIIAVIGVLGGVGWYVWHSNQKTTETAKTTGVTTYEQCTKAKNAKSLQTVPEVCVVDGKRFINPNQKVSATTKPTTTPTPSSQKYFVIKEWGVKGLNPDNLTLKYAFKSDDSNIIYFTSEELATAAKPYCGFDKDGKASNTPSTGGLGANVSLLRTKNGDLVVAYPDAKANEIGKNINGIWYVYRSAQSACSVTANDNQLTTQTIEAVSNFYGSLSAN